MVIRMTNNEFLALAIGLAVGGAATRAQPEFGSGVILAAVAIYFLAISRARFLEIDDGGDQ